MPLDAAVTGAGLAGLSAEFQILNEQAQPMDRY